MFEVGSQPLQPSRGTVSSGRRCLLDPETHYARSEDLHIAYQVVGDGPRDLVLVPPFVSHLELYWEEPLVERFLRRLASFSRLILFDKRGTGLSDRVPSTDLPTLEQRMDDVRAVMDRAGSERAAVMGFSEGGPMSAMFAATHPQRTTALVLYGTFASTIRSADYPWAMDAEAREEIIRELPETWGQGTSVDELAPSLATDQRFRRWYGRVERMGASPGAAMALRRMNGQIDIRHVLPIIGVPTLVLHRSGDRDSSLEEGRYLADRIPGARFIELPGEDHFPWAGDQDAIIDEVEEFLTGMRPGPEPDRVLATVMFTDIVRSTERAIELGDRRWRDLLNSHNTLVRGLCSGSEGERSRRSETVSWQPSTGPPAPSAAPPPSVTRFEDLTIQIRAGLHTGECELMGDDVGGIAVHIAARVAAKAGPDQVLVSSTVKDLVAGSGIRFEDMGVHRLKGIPGHWRLFSAT